MAEIVMKALPGAEPDTWAELHLLKCDIIASIEGMTLLANKYIDHPNPNADDITITCSLFRDAVVRFVGCFDAKEQQHRLSADELYGAGTSSREDFDMLHAIRKAFIAQRIGSLRQAVFGIAMLSSGRRFTMAHALIHRHPDQDEAERILKIMRMAETHLTTKVEVVEGRLRAAMKAMSQAEFEALPAAEVYHDIRLDEIAMPRRAFVKRRRAAGGGITLSVEETTLDTWDHVLTGESARKESA